MALHLQLHFCKLQASCSCIANPSSLRRKNGLCRGWGEGPVESKFVEMSDEAWNCRFFCGQSCGECRREWVGWGGLRKIQGKRQEIEQGVHQVVSHQARSVFSLLSKWYDPAVMPSFHPPFSLVMDRFLYQSVRLIAYSWYCKTKEIITDTK